MKKLNLNIVAVMVALIAMVGLVKGQLVLFVGFLILSGMILGANKIISLEQGLIQGQSIKKSNLKLALTGIVASILTNSGIPVIDLLASFTFGACFGLIAVNFIFEKSKV
jgi:hypothetical protein